MENHGNGGTDSGDCCGGLSSCTAAHLLVLLFLFLFRLFEQFCPKVIVALNLAGIFSNFFETTTCRFPNLSEVELQTTLRCEGLGSSCRLFCPFNKVLNILLRVCTMINPRYKGLGMVGTDNECRFAPNFPQREP